MRWPTLSAGSWKVLLSILALFVTGLWMTELWYAPRTLAPGAAGTLGIKYHELPQWGRSRYVIDEIAPDSPLLAEGARVGDVWFPDRYYDAKRRLLAHERIGLTLVKGDSSRHLTVVVSPDTTPVPPILFVMRWTISLLALTLGLIVGFRQPDRVASRALSAMLVIMTAFKMLPGIEPSTGGAFLLRHLLWSPAMFAAFICWTIFLFNFPDDQPRNTALKRWLLRWAMPALIISGLVDALGNLVHASGFYVPPHPALMATNALVFAFIAYAVMVNNWRISQGDDRQRHLWILLAFAGMTIASPVASLARFELSNLQMQLLTEGLARSLTLSSLLLFGYAVLRHRVMSVGFAINRAMVYGVASIAMLSSFGLLEWAAHHLLEFTGRERIVWLDAAIALGIFLTFHRLRHWGEQLIERLFFHAWHQKEQALRKFVKEAPFITRAEALLTAFTAALERFTGGAPLALYRRTPKGHYESVTSTLAAAPARVDTDDPLVVSLRTSQSVTHPTDTHSSLPGELALPSVHHGELDGFVLMGPKPNGETYRPDEIGVLGHAAHQVGLDFRALRMEQLESEVAALSTRVRDLQAHNADLRLALQRGG
jgi:hypothetical protein